MKLKKVKTMNKMKMKKMKNSERRREAASYRKKKTPQNRWGKN